MHWNRFDIAEAYYCYFVNWHGGQWSPEYARLSKLLKSFKPRADLSVETLEDNGREIYESILEREQGMSIRRYTLPAYWACYLVNGDASGLEDGEQEDIDAWIESENPGDCTDCDEPYFSWTNDATDLGGDVTDYTFIHRKHIHG